MRGLVPIFGVFTIALSLFALATRPPKQPTQAVLALSSIALASGTLIASASKP